METYSRLVGENIFFDAISADIFSDIKSSYNYIISLKDENLKIQLLKELLLRNFNEAFPLFFGNQLSYDERLKLSPLILTKFNSLIHIEDFFNGCAYSEKPHPEHFNQIKESLLYIGKNGLLSKDVIDCITYKNTKLLNIKFIWKDGLISEHDLENNTKGELWKKQKKLYQYKTGFNMNLFLSNNIPEVIITQLYDSLRSFYDFLGDTDCKSLLSKIRFNDTININNSGSLIVKFLRKLYRHLIICGSHFIINDINNNLIDNDLHTIMNKIDQYDLLRFQSLFKQETGLEISTENLFERYGENLDTLLFLSARFASESSLLSGKKLFFLIIKELLFGSFNKFYLPLGFGDEVLLDNYNRQTSIVNNAGSWANENFFLIETLSNIIEINQISKESTMGLKNIFRDKIINAGLVDQILNHSYYKTLSKISNDERNIIKSCNVPIIKEYFTKKENGCYYYLYGILDCIEEEEDFTKLKKYILTFLTTHIFNRLSETTDLSNDCIGGDHFNAVIAYAKSIIIPQENQEFVFTTEIDDPIGIFSLGSRESIRARNCLDYTYIDSRTLSLLSFAIDPSVKIIFTWRLDQNNFENSNDYNDFKKFAGDTLHSGNVQFDQNKKILTIMRGGDKIVINLKDAVVLKMLRIVEDSNGDLFLFTDNELYKDNANESKYSTLTNEYILELSKRIGIKLLTLEDHGKRLLIKQSASPGGTYSKYGNHIFQDTECIFKP